MSTEGIRVELRVGDPGSCGVARATSTGEGSVEGVARTLQEGVLVQEFTLQGEDARSIAATSDDLDAIFEWDEGVRCRERGVHASACVCSALSEFGYPIDDVVAEEGGLSFSFYTLDTDCLEDVVSVLRSQFEDVAVRSLERDCDLADRDPVVVNRADLTDRQREVLETAFEMGYFETPKRSNASDVAAELDVALATVCEHLAAAERTVLEMLLETE